MDVETAVQKAIRGRLVAAPDLLALVPAGNILDTNKAPAPRPSIIMGESQAVDEGADLGRRLHVWHTLHLWVTEPSTAKVKAIAGAIRGAILSGHLDLGVGWHCASAFVASQRFMRDPDGETSHGVVTVELQVQGAEQ